MTCCTSLTRSPFRGRAFHSPPERAATGGLRGPTALNGSSRMRWSTPGFSIERQHNKGMRRRVPGGGSAGALSVRGAAGRASARSAPSCVCARCAGEMWAARVRRVGLRYVSSVEGDLALRYLLIDKGAGSAEPLVLVADRIPRAACGDKRLPITQTPKRDRSA